MKKLLASLIIVFSASLVAAATKDLPKDVHLKYDLKVNKTSKNHLNTKNEFEMKFDGQVDNKADFNKKCLNTLCKVARDGQRKNFSALNRNVEPFSDKTKNMYGFSMTMPFNDDE